jgi:hypothetical protein
LRVRSHISPGPYRSFRELSLAGSVDPDIWCPPTFVGNSGIECSNGLCGFALFLPSLRSAACVIPIASFYPAKADFQCAVALNDGVAAYWITRVCR